MGEKSGSLARGEKLIIAVDAFGGDFAPSEVVKGAIKAIEEYDIEIALVGKKEILHVLTSHYAKKLKKSRFSIVEANEVIGFGESPMRALVSKPNSTVLVGINLVRDGHASAFVSAGPSGATAAAALLNLGKIEGIPRPAIGSFINITSMPVLLIDSGANVDCRPEHLVWFAYLGAHFVNQILGIPSPRIGLLSNGEEDTKGNKAIVEANQLLKKTPLNFIGNIEGHDIMSRKADVVVTDGLIGNIVLKTIEGLSDSWLSSLNQAKQLFAKAYSVSLRALHRDMNIDSWTKRLDYQEYGGACLFGVNGTVIIAHGRSKSKAIKNAIGLARRTVEKASDTGSAAKAFTDFISQETEAVGTKVSGNQA